MCKDVEKLQRTAMNDMEALRQTVKNMLVQKQEEKETTHLLDFLAIFSWDTLLQLEGKLPNVQIGYIDNVFIIILNETEENNPFTKITQVKGLLWS